MRADDAPREVLPCPNGGSASARLTSDGKHIWVYGTHDEYIGGFAYLLDMATLTVLRTIEVAAPVEAVDEDASRETLLISTYHGLVVWQQGQLRPLPLAARDACFSPNGQYIATMGDGLKLWSLADAGRGVEAPGPGFATRFDPTGDRLLTGPWLFDGHTGALLATLDTGISPYLEGGPGQPQFHPARA